MDDKKVKEFYNSRRWKQKRIDILKRDRWECQDCIERLRDAVNKGILLHGSENKIRRAVEVHHIKELKEHKELGLEEENLISLCTQCHNIRHGRNPKRFVKKKKRINDEKW